MRNFLYRDISKAKMVRDSLNIWHSLGKPLEGPKMVGLWGFEKESKAKNNKKAPEHIKKKVWQNQWKSKATGECFCCGRKPLHFNDSEVGHVQAKSKGGTWAIENLRLICRMCNSGMRNTNMKLYMKKYYPDRYKVLFYKNEKERVARNKPKRGSNYSPFGDLDFKFELPKH